MKRVVSKAGPYRHSAPRSNPASTVLALAALALAAVAAATWADEDEAPTPRAGTEAQVSGADAHLSQEQQQAAGVTVTHPVMSTAAPFVEGFVQVLHAGVMLMEAGRAETLRSNARVARQEADRLDTLARSAGDASLRAVQTAQAQAFEAESLARTADASFALQWGPVAKLTEEPRRALIKSLADGKAVLVRADVPGSFDLGVLSALATLTVDGAPVPARVLGVLRRSPSELPSASVLLKVEPAPPGLGPGAHVPVRLQRAARGGVLVPSGALLYGPQGTYLYRQVAGGASVHRYEPVNVKLLQAVGADWLVAGVNENELIVASGAGVLWSLQGIGSFSAEEDDHD